MGRYKYRVRVFCCPDCNKRMYAPKNLRHMTKPGHKKVMWCPWCKENKNFEQVE